MSEPRAHELKTLREPFQAVLDGVKRFEFRRNDRDFVIGDVLELREWSPGNVIHDLGYSGRRVEVEVLYIAHGGRFGIPEGFCVMSIRRKHP